MSDQLSEQTISHMMGLDFQPAHYLKKWRKTVLFDVAGILSDPKMPDIQKKVGLWPYGDRIPYPEPTAFQILDNGCMSFSVKVGNEPVFFSLWMMVGEVRIGVKVPASLLLSEAVRTKLAKAYDGHDCQRVEKIGTATLFDWIWRDRAWAGFDFMLKSITLPIESSVLAEHIASITGHIYLSVIHTLIEGNSLPVAFNRIFCQDSSCWLVQETGDEDVFIGHANLFRWEVDSTREVDNNGRKERLHAIRVLDGKHPTIGPIRNQDGSISNITAVKQVD
jgi:hypothetical protein